MRKMKMYDSNEYFLVPRNIIPDNHHVLTCGCMGCRTEAAEMVYNIRKEAEKQGV